MKAITLIIFTLFYTFVFSQETTKIDSNLTLQEYLKKEFPDSSPSHSQIEAYSQYGRELMEGGVNDIRIRSPFKSFREKVSVSNGTIQRAFSTNITIKNGEMINLTDSIYKWKICKSGIGLEKLFVSYYKGDTLIMTDTIRFSTKSYPIITAKPGRGKVKNGSFEEDSVCAENVTGINLSELYWSDLFETKIEGYKIEIFRNNKIIKTLINRGRVIEEENKKIILARKNDYIKISDIVAVLECGLRLIVKDPDIVYYHN
jgi:hypothetical protein